MAWEKVEEKLQKALTVKISFPGGTVWLPASHLSIDEWLESIAESDEELRELEIPRIRFLQNHWVIDQLVELEWDDAFSNRRVILAMSVGHRAYILFSDWSDYVVIAALEPKDNKTLYRTVVGKILENRSFVPTTPSHIRNHRPDLVPEVVPLAESDADEEGVESRPVPGRLAGLDRSAWKTFLSDVLVGWIGKWLNLRELGFWHEDMPESITRADQGEIIMKYQPSNTEKSGAGKDRGRRTA